MSTIEVLRNSGANLDQTFYADGAPIDADGAVTVTITRADGSALVTDAATAHQSTNSGTYRYVLAPQADLNLLTARWTGTFDGLVQSVESTVELVGGFYLSLAEIRALPNLDNTTKFPVAKLVLARRWFESVAEEAAGRFFVPRFRRVRVCGTDGYGLRLPDFDVRRVLSVRDYSSAIAYTVFDADDLADLVVLGGGKVVRSSRGTWTSPSTNFDNLLVEYEAGADAVPSKIREAGAVAIRDRLLKERNGQPMLALADGAGGTTRFSFAGPGRPTGIPDVDVVLNSYPKILVG